MTSINSLIAEKLFGLSGKVALVTGGGSGIGLMVAQSLAANGAKVYICGHVKDKIDRAASAHGEGVAGEIVPIQADPSSREGITSLVNDIQSRESHLCILVNNADISRGMLGPGEAGSREQLDGSFFNHMTTYYTETETNRTQNVAAESNIPAAYVIASAFLPLLQAATETHPGWSPVVINITSLANPQRAAEDQYSPIASKAVVDRLTRMMARELLGAKLKVRVNSIAPGDFQSETTTGESDLTQKSNMGNEELEDEIPAGRPGKDEDLAQAVLFVAASRYVNGQTVVVDGGYTIASGQ